jgi:TetR/AcrR family transcriptional repressor of nem operon
VELAVTATRGRILDVAQRLIQARGFSGFSYADIAEEVGIRKASIHHHFPSKADLAVALMVRYRATFELALSAIARDHVKAAARLEAYRRLFAGVLRDDHRLCMCGMFAAGFEALSPEVRREVRGFFEDNEAWLESVLAEGKRRGEASFRGSARMRARVVLAGLEGAMLVARTHQDVARFDAIARAVLADALGDG